VLFEVFDRDPPPEREVKLTTRAPLLRGVEALLHHDIATARTHFEGCLALAPNDRAAANLLKSCSSDA